MKAMMKMLDLSKMTDATGHAHALCAGFRKSDLLLQVAAMLGSDASSSPPVSPIAASCEQEGGLEDSDDHDEPEEDRMTVKMTDFRLHVSD